MVILYHLFSYPATDSAFNHGHLVLEIHTLGHCLVSLTNKIDLEDERAKTGG